MTFDPATELLLQPWIEHAQNFICASLNALATEDDLANMWIEWEHQELQHDDWIRILEALELLDLSARIDNRATWRAILGWLNLSSYEHLLETLLEPIFPKHAIPWNDSFRSEGVVFSKDAHSESFFDVKQELTQRISNSRCPFERDSHQRIQVRFTFHTVTSQRGHNSGVETELHEAAELALFQSDPTRRQLFYEMWRCGYGTSGFETDCSPTPTNVFNWTSVDVDLRGLGLTDATLTCLDTMAHNGILLSSLRMGWCQYDAGVLSVKAVFQSFHIFGLVGAARMAVTDEMEMLVQQAFFAALIDSRAIKELHFESMRSESWAWLALAVFSVEANNSVKRILLEAQQFKQWHYRIVERVLSARDPLAVVSHCRHIIVSPQREQRIQRSPCERVDLVAGCSILVRKLTPAARMEIVSLDEDAAMNLRLVDGVTSRTHICVLCPGLGFGWVGRDAIVARRVVPENNRNALISGRTFDRITLRLGPSSELSAVLALICELGPRNLGLTLEAATPIQLGDDFGQCLVAGCTNLEYLEIRSVALESFKWLSGARIKSLVLDEVRCNDEHGYADFLAAHSNALLPPASY